MSAAEEEQRLKCLVVDDTDDIREMLVLLFEREGFETRGATCGAEGMAMFWEALAKDMPFALAIVDIAMPGIDGFEVEQKMRMAERDLKRERRCVIIANTGYDRETDSMTRLESSTFDAIVTKADPPESLPVLARKLLECAK